MEKYKAEWVKEWSIKDIISNAVSLGMEFMATRIDVEILKYNKNILVKELYRKNSNKTI